MEELKKIQADKRYVDAEALVKGKEYEQAVAAFGSLLNSVSVFLLRAGA